MKNFSKVREWYGLSQADVAKVFGMPQPTYTNYEVGKTQKIPSEFVREFAYRYMVNECWLMGGSVPGSDNSRLSVLIANRLPEAAKRLRLPMPFLEAICANEVVCSHELDMLILSEFSNDRRAWTPATHADRSVRDIWEKIDEIEARQSSELARLTAENARLLQKNEELSSKVIALLEGRLGLVSPAPVPCPAPYEESYSQSAG